jgi:hypothetical protein
VGPAGGGGSVGFQLPTDGPAWKTRSTPFCAGVDPWLPNVAIWSNPQSVFVAMGSSVYQTVGAGWSELLSKPSLTFSGITGFLEGPLVLTAQSGSRCGILLFDGDGLRCSGAAQNVFGVFAVDATLAYAMASNRLLVYRGDFWTQVGALPDQTGVYGPKFWADRDNAFVTAAQGAVLRYELATDETSALPSFSPNGEAWALWGFSRDDLWLASDSEELLHYDGTDWQPVFTQSGACGRIIGMWGQAGVLYFYTSSTLYRMQGQRAEPILTLPCDDWQSQSIRSVWGNSPSEVFIAIQNYRVEQRVDAEGVVSTVSSPADACGAARILYFDGKGVGAL